MKSGKKIDYEVRPNKFVERRMILASLARIIGAMKKDYQYIGFGAYTFVDFKLFHRELQITRMYSIEGGANISKRKILINKPFSCINMIYKKSTDALLDLDNNLEVPSIIWLDYDGALDKYMFIDIEIILKKIPTGSVFIMSCNKQLKKDGTSIYTNEEFRDEFGDLVPMDVAEHCCNDDNDHLTIQKMLSQKIQSTLEERKKNSGNKYIFEQLYNFLYKDGAKMYTYGGILLEDGENIERLHLEDFDFINTATPYKIDVPQLTTNEEICLNKALFDDVKEKVLVKSGVVTEKEIEKYKKVYKYMASFHDVRM